MKKLVVAAAMMLAAVLPQRTMGRVVNLPQGYTQVEYVGLCTERSSVYVDLGTKLTSEDTVVIDCECRTKDLGSLYGSRTSARDNNFSVCFDNNNNNQFHIDCGPYESCRLTMTDCGVGARLLITNSATIATCCNLTTGAVKTKERSGVNPFETPSNAWLFNIGNNRASSVSFIGRVYSFKIIRGGQVRMDLIPCTRDMGSVAGFYDIASNPGVFLTLKDSAFDDIGEPVSISGPALPPEYATLTYLESTGGMQYVDTGVHPSESLRLEMRCQLVDSADSTDMSMGMVEQLQSGGYSHFCFAVACADTGDRTACVYLRNSKAGRDFKLDDGFGNAWHVLTIDARNSIAYFDRDVPQVTKFNVQDNNASSSSVPSLPAAFECPSACPLDPESNSTFWLFMCNSNDEDLRGCSRMRIASAEFWDDATKVRDLVPCERIADGVLGFYDLVEKEFLPCEGKNAGGFLKGERIEFVLRPVGNVFYEGENTKHPAVKVRAVEGGRNLTEGTDYELVFGNDTVPGQATVSVQGLGDFEGQVLQTKYWVVPKLPKGYTALQAIRSTGKQYIDLGCPVSDATEFSTRVFVENAYHPVKVIDDQYTTVLGVRRDNSEEFRITARVSPYTSEWLAYFGNMKKEDYGANNPPADRDTEIVYRSKWLTFNGDSAFRFDPPAFSPSKNLHLFGFWDQSASRFVHPIQMRMWGFRMWEKSVLVRDLVPCQASDGTVGLYDLAATGEAKAFYSSETDTGFEAGEPCPAVAAPAGMAIFFCSTLAIP